MKPDRGLWAKEAMAREASAAAAAHTKRQRKGAANDLRILAAVVGNEAINKVVVPTIDRVLRGDIDLVDLDAGKETGLVKVLRAKGLGYRLRRMGFDDAQIATALRFSRAFDKARIGGLTSNYEGAPGTKRTSEPERWLLAMEELAHASNKLTEDERVVVYGQVLFDVAAADVGAFVCAGVTGDKNMMCFTTKLYLGKALNKLELFYEDLDWQAENIKKQQNSLATCP